VVPQHKNQETLITNYFLGFVHNKWLVVPAIFILFCTMKKIYHLANCGTCQTILGKIKAEKKGYELQNIKTEKISPQQLEQLKELAGSYEALFSRRALKYKEMGLKDKKLTEKDYRKLILDEYTFLKRPVVVNGKKIFIGSEKKTVAALEKEA